MAVRKRGKYLYIDFYCYLPDGRKIRCVESTGLKDTPKNRKIVEMKNKAIEYELKHGHFDYLHFFPNGPKAKYFRSLKGDITFDEAWNRWLETKSIRKTTMRGWGSAYEKHIFTHFGHLYLKEIDEDQIRVFRRILEEQKNLSPSYINNRIIKPLCMCLLWAYKKGMIPSYPCQNIKRLKEVPPEIDPFSFEELKRLLNTLRGRYPMYHDMILIWARTGLRPGELYALKWQNIDYFNRKILVRETRTESVEGPPKTSCSVRNVDMREMVFQALKRQEARTGLKGGYVFLTEAGNPFSDAFMRKKFKYFCRLAGLKYRPPKQMRHTFATLHIAAGENISWVSKMLGHSSVEITLKRYNRFIPNLTREDGSAFEKVFEGI